MQSNVLYRSLNGNDFHIGVGSDVVCSTIIGNARASVRGIDNRTIPRFFMPIIVDLKQDIKNDIRIISATIPTSSRALSRWKK